MNKKNLNIFLEKHESDFVFVKDKSNLNISFNRISFIFFIFSLIGIIYSIQLAHLGSRQNNTVDKAKIQKNSNKLYRADIIDRNGRYLVKTVSSIDIGIRSHQVIDKKKLIINLKYIFPDKNYDLIKKQLDDKKFFYFEKKISEGNYEKIINLEINQFNLRKN